MFYRSSVSPKPRRVPRNAGFSMVELLVSIGIVVMVLSVVVTRQGAFNSAVLLRGQAYDIALAMREVQLGSISAVSDGSGEFRTVQGADFDTTVDNNQRFRLFRDINGNNTWNNGEDIGFSGSIDPRFELRDITLDDDSSPEQITILFERPNFDALFYNSLGNQIITPAVTLTIGLRGGAGTECGQDVREVQIRSTGQIAVIEC